MAAQLGAPTGMGTVPVASAPVPPAVIAVSSGSQYLRFKRRHQTVFLHCEPGELLGAVKLRLAAVLGVDELDIRLYELMSPERKAHVMQLLEEKVREAAKLMKKKPGQPKHDVEAEVAALEVPPLPDEKKLWELGLENDAIVFWVFRTHPNTDWDEWECVDVPGLQESTGKTLGSCAGQIPGGDGFDPPGTAAARAEAARQEEMRQQAERERAAQQARDQEAAVLAQGQSESQAQ